MKICSRRNTILRPLGAVAIALVGVLAASAPAVAAKRTIVRGKITHSARYTLALTTSGGASATVKLKGSGAFALRVPKGSGATLSLIAPNGRYWGPVVVRSGKGKRARAYVTLRPRGTLNLGTIVRHSSYAAPKRALPARLVGKRSVRVDRRGKPVGAGKLGLVLLHTHARAHKAQAGPPKPPQTSVDLGADTDGDGLINAYDVDDDGDGILDSSDPDEGPSQNQLGRIFTNLWGSDATDTVNADAGGATPAALDAMVQKNLSAALIVNPQFALPGQQVTGVNVDCFALAWCRPGDGTAEVQPDGLYGPGGGPLSGPWAKVDPDSDGLPNLVADPRNPGSGVYAMNVYPRQPATGLHPDDTVNFHIATAAGRTDYATTFGPFFVTTPAVAQIDGQALHYPMNPGDPGTGGGQPGADIAVSSFKLHIELWRPQRLTIPGAEAGEFMDMGHLNYMVENPTGQDGRSCPASTYSELSPTLSPSGDGYYEWLSDAAPDAAPDPANKVSFTVDFGACAGVSNIAGRAIPFTVAVRTTRGENTSQKLWVRFPAS